jgi:hypothetical protein
VDHKGRKMKRRLWSEWHPAAYALSTSSPSALATMPDEAQHGRCAQRWQLAADSNGAKLNPAAGCRKVGGDPSLLRVLVVL